MPLMSIACVVGAFQRNTALMKPAIPGQVVSVGETSTNTQYVLAPQTIASHARRAGDPPELLAKPQGNLPSATEIRAFALCWPSSLANAVEPMPMTTHWPALGVQTSSPL